jgi:hypothetical protein
MSPDKIEVEITRLKAECADAEAQLVAVQERSRKDLEQLKQLRKYSRRDAAFRFLRSSIFQQRTKSISQRLKMLSPTLRPARGNA